MSGHLYAVGILKTKRKIMENQQKIKLVPNPKLSRAEEILSRTSDNFDFDETEVLRMCGGSAANGDKNDPIVYVGKAESKMRNLIEKYCFDRVPQTYGEYQGFIEYCSTIDVYFGEGVVAPSRQKEWAQAGFSLWEQSMPKFKPAFKLYVDGDLAGLLKYHQENSVLAQLGKDFNEFSNGWTE
jgi:hypothetical protein